MTVKGELKSLYNLVPIKTVVTLRDVIYTDLHTDISIQFVKTHPYLKV